MAIRYAVSSSTWSNLNTWDGGTLPSTSDDVYADGYTINIDQDITVISINTTQRSGGIVGGAFTVDTNRTINANIQAGGSVCLTSNVYSPNELRLNGTIQGTTTNLTVGSGVVHNGTGAVYVNGNIISGLGNSYFSHGFWNTSTASLSVTGNVLSIGAGIGANMRGAGINNAGTGNVVIYGGITGSTYAGTNYSPGLYNASTGSVTVYGNITGGGGAATSGIWNISSGHLIISGNVTGGNVAAGISNAGVATIDIVGDVTAGGALSNNYGVNNGSSGTVNITGFTGGGGTSSIYNGSTGTINIYNDVYQVSSAYGSLRNRGAGNIHIYGNAIGGTIGTNIIYNDGAGTATIHGDVIMGSGISAGATVGMLYNLGSGIIHITGNVSGGTNANGIAISNSSNGKIEVEGNIVGGTNSSNAPAIYSQITNTNIVSGNTIADGSPALISTSLGSTNILYGDLISKNGINPVYAATITVGNNTGQTITLQDELNNNRTLSLAFSTSGQPSIGDVRYDTIYGLSNEFVGTCHIPPKEAVSIGVSVDHTIGTLTLSPSDFWNYAQSGITNGIGSRVKECATVNTVGEQLEFLL